MDVENSKHFIWPLGPTKLEVAVTLRPAFFEPYLSTSEAYQRALAADYCEVTGLS